MPSIKTSFATVSLFILFIFACLAYAANAQESKPASAELTPQERYAVMEAEREAARAAREASFAEMKTERETIKAERQADMASSSEVRQAALVERRAALDVRAQKRITNLAANISNRMDAAVARLNQIIDRLTARTTELEAKGVDTVEAEVHIADAKTAVDAAAALLADIDEEMASVTGSESPREKWTAVREIFLNVKAELVKARESLRAAVASLKAAVSENGGGNGVSDAVQAEAAAEREETTSGTEVAE
ncbi:MAG: hypothetical protein AUK16_02435 [Parcubacteria group bacterium CG2_30_44_11]|nr:MAG: hypothetical protein AUK16_02435 [Parcubacteria group bacterium CG2_30_44_11]